MEKNTNVERAGDLNSALAEVTAADDAIFDAAFEKWKAAYWDIMFDRAWLATCQECEGEDLGFTHTCHSGLPWTVPPGELEEGMAEYYAGVCEDDTKDGSSRVCKDCFDKILSKAIDAEIDVEMENSFQAFYDWAADHADDKPCSCESQ